MKEASPQAHFWHLNFSWSHLSPNLLEPQSFLYRGTTLLTFVRGGFRSNFVFQIKPLLHWNRHKKHGQKSENVCLEVPLPFMLDEGTPLHMLNFQEYRSVEATFHLACWKPRFSVQGKLRCFHIYGDVLARTQFFTANRFYLKPGLRNILRNQRTCLYISLCLLCLLWNAGLKEKSLCFGKLLWIEFLRFDM